VLLAVAPAPPVTSKLGRGSSRPTVVTLCGKGVGPSPTPTVSEVELDAELPNTLLRPVGGGGDAAGASGTGAAIDASVWLSEVGDVEEVERLDL